MTFLVIGRAGEIFRPLVLHRDLKKTGLMALSSSISQNLIAALRRMGLELTVLPSLTLCNTHQEIDCFISIGKSFAKFR